MFRQRKPVVASDDCAVEDSVYCVSCILETVIDFLKLGVIWIRPDVMKRRLRVVVDQWATLKADHNF